MIKLMRKTKARIEFAIFAARLMRRVIEIEATDRVAAGEVFRAGLEELRRKVRREKEVDAGVAFDTFDPILVRPNGLREKIVVGGARVTIGKVKP